MFSIIEIIIYRIVQIVAQRGTAHNKITLNILFWGNFIKLSYPRVPVKRHRKYRILNRVMKLQIPCYPIVKNNSTKRKSSHVHVSSHLKIHPSHDNKTDDGLQKSPCLCEWSPPDSSINEHFFRKLLRMFQTLRKMTCYML